MARHAEIRPLEGPLSKQRRLKTWCWSKYWFWLDNDQLTYYKDKEVSITEQKLGCVLDIH